MERKIHHEGWGGKKSAKERCVLPQEAGAGMCSRQSACSPGAQDIFDFMKGKFDIDGYFKQRLG